jgi:hypothetical protein
VLSGEATNTNLSYLLNRIGGVIVSVHASSVVDCQFDPGRVKSKTMKLVFGEKKLIFIDMMMKSALF